jgi:hypothetical protein
MGGKIGLGNRKTMHGILVQLIISYLTCQMRIITLPTCPITNKPSADR